MLRPLGFLLALAALTPSPGLAADGVTYATRVDKKNRVYVDVQNESRTDIVVTSVVVAFYDKRKALLDKTTIECTMDCSVDAKDAESFGPIEGPDGWSTVKVTKVLFNDASDEDEEVEPPPPPSPKSTRKPPAQPDSKDRAPTGTAALPVPTDGRSESLDGYAEWWQSGVLVVDGQRVRFGAGAKFKGSGDIKRFAQIPLGYEVKVKGRRSADGVLVAEKIETKENGRALFEDDLRTAFDEQEQKYLTERRMYDEDEDGKREDYGRLVATGARVDRVRGILDRLVPGYLAERDFRIYVVENQEWNAMAAPNDSIYVFGGLLKDFDDDEVAIILGHELAHATHEHSRKQYKKDILIQLATLGIVAITEEAVGDKNKRAVLQVAALLGSQAWTSGYGRNHEDQADRVGLRYANEAGFDVRKGPRLWNRFAEKYGDSPKLLNFFFGDHSVAEDRARNLTRELALNYRR